MILTTLKDRFSFLKKRLFVFFAFTPEQSNNFERKQYKRSLVPLSEMILRIQDPENLKNNINKIVDFHKTKTVKRIARFFSYIDKKFITDTEKKRILGSLKLRFDNLKNQLIKKLEGVRLKNKLEYFNKTHLREYKTLISKILDASDDSTTLRATSSVSPKKKSSPNTRPKPKIKAEEQILEKYDIDYQFKKDLRKKIVVDFTNKWMTEGWRTDIHQEKLYSVKHFTKEFVDNWIKKSTKFKYQEYNSGEESALAYMADLIGGKNAHSPDNPLRTIIKANYDAYHAFGNQDYQREDSRRFAMLYGGYAWHKRLRKMFFKGFNLNANGTISYSNESINKKNIDKNSNAPGRLFRFFDYLKKHKNVSKERFERFLSHHADDAEAMLTIKKALRGYNGKKEILLDDYEKGLNERFYIEMFQEYGIAPEIWYRLPDVYRQVVREYKGTQISREKFVEALKNMGTKKYPRIKTGAYTSNEVFYIDCPGKTKTLLKNVPKEYVRSLRGLKYYLINTSSKKLDSRKQTLLRYHKQKHLNSPPKYYFNLKYLSFRGTKLKTARKNILLSSPYTIDGKTLPGYKFDWNRILKKHWRFTLIWKKRMNTVLAAHHIRLGKVSNGVSFEEVIDHSAQFLARVESLRFNPGKTPSDKPLKYSLDGVELIYDPKLDTQLARKSYRIALKGYFNIQFREAYGVNKKKVAFALHLMQKAQGVKIDITPRMLVTLLKGNRRPLRLHGDPKQVIPDPLPNIYKMGKYLSIYQMGDDYWLNVRGKEITLDKDKANAYFKTCK